MKIDCDCGKTVFAMQVKKPEAPGAPLPGWALLVNAGVPGTNFSIVCDNCGRGIIAFVVADDHCKTFGEGRPQA